MPLALPNLTNVPPGGWEYQIPETGRIVVGSNLAELQLKIASQYSGGGYAVPSDLLVRIEAYMCGLERMKDYCSERNDSVFSKITRSLSMSGDVFHTFHAAVQCMKTLMSHIGGTGEKITQEVAEYRSAICAACPKNSNVSGCTQCNKGVIGQLISRIVGARLTAHDGDLMFCQVCHCNTRAKIWVKHEAIFRHMPESQKKSLPDNCWIITEGK